MKQIFLLPSVNFACSLSVLNHESKPMKHIWCDLLTTSSLTFSTQPRVETDETATRQELADAVEDLSVLNHESKPMKPVAY